MTWEIGLVLAILAGAVVLFASERYPIDLTAMLVPGSLLLFRLVSPEEGVSGFANPATVTVAASNPSIVLNKTVGTDPLACATTDEIVLPPGGGEVIYCYEVTNTGDLTLNLHDLDDSELGNLLGVFQMS